MYIDNELMLSNAQAITVDAASTNVIDLGPGGRNIAFGEPMALCISVGVAADFTTGDETYTFTVRTSASADLSTPTDTGSKTVLAASLTAGALVIIPLPFSVGAPLRYIGLFFDTGGTTPTMTGKAWLTPMSMIQEYQSYAKGYTVS